MRSILLTTILFSTFFLQSQIFIKGKLESGNPANCEAMITCSHINVPIGSELSLTTANIGNPPTMQNLTFTDTISGICDDSWYGIDARYFLTGTNGDTIATSLIYPQNFDYFISGYTAPSSPVSSDGSLSITFSQPLVYGWPPSSSNMLYASDGALLGATTSDNLTFVLNNISEGLMYIYVDYMGIELTIQGYIGDYSNSIVNNNLSVNYNITDSDNNCNGTSELIPDPSAVGLTYTWNEIQYNGLSEVSNMCPGIYRVLIEETSGDNRLIEFLITDSTENFYEPWTNTTQPSDTLNFILEDCSIDFTLPIDSISWTETLLSVSDDTSFYSFDLFIFQGNDTLFFTDSFFISADSLTYLSCGFYCESFKSNEFNGFKVYLSRDGTQQSFVAQIYENTQNFMNIYPNPTEDFLFLNGCENAILYDTFGKKIMHLKEGGNDVKMLRKGTYFVQDHNKRCKVIIQ